MACCSSLLHIYRLNRSHPDVESFASEGISVQATLLLEAQECVKAYMGTYFVKQHPAAQQTSTRWLRSTPRVDMLIEGREFSVFRPARCDRNNDQPLISDPEIWISTLEQKISWLDGLIRRFEGDESSGLERARYAYLEALKKICSGTVYGKAEASVSPATISGRQSLNPFNEAVREGGEDWTYLGTTMIGIKRLENIELLLKSVVNNKIPGDFIETGVWRGGASLFARGVLRAHGEGHRTSYVCDSFQGLPPNTNNLHEGDDGWNFRPYLEVSDVLVRSHFCETSMLDKNVIFVKGFFNATMPPLARIITRLSIMRLDGDMYQSTVDVLYNLYEKLSVGGYVIIDDWTITPTQQACKDFFSVHEFHPKIIWIDSMAVYWQKNEEISVQYWRYQELQFFE